ncbi:MAG: type II toxin-antitoxin system RelE/ParE family toxin [Aestuariivirga sp.]|uniref:type II toxin-antitoxin system RelE/ParE family toxin n=1 Tax=Aestuariivirga sp. TaxID=2650926 RepID=UPI0038CF696C
MRVAFSPRAAHDIEEIGDYIFLDNPQAALKFIAGLRARCARLSSSPLGGAARPELGENLRSVPFGRYVIFYTPLPDQILIERVLHGARDIPVIYGEEI